MADRTPRYTSVAGVLTVAVVAVGVAMSPVASEPPKEQIHAPEVPLAEVNLDNVIPRRTPFCDNISDEAVTTAVEGSAVESAYVNGERATLEPGLTDIAHEFGCVFTRRQTVARVWVFAAPITRYDAEAMVRAATADETCTATGPLRFGSPGAVMQCTADGTRSLLAVGRIGDAWVHCELSRPATDIDPRLSSRGQRWCVEAAYAMQG
ncbi:MAG TPA: hypothetical protein VLI04_05335 [Nocardioidaceae bacterium]|nr:hypothetical protein [Nocardioidaceae bacterium]